MSAAGRETTGMPATLDPNLAVGAILFVLGAIGVLTRRNLILIVLSAEMMLHGVALTVAACEAGLALSLILSLYHRTKSLDVNLWTSIRESDLGPPAVDEPGPLSTPTDIHDYPRLTPSGGLPDLDGAERTLLAEKND